MVITHLMHGFESESRFLSGSLQASTNYKYYGGSTLNSLKQIGMLRKRFPSISIK